MTDADLPRVLVLNGPNLDVLGTREPAVSSLLSDVAHAVIVGAGIRGCAFGLEVLSDLLAHRR